jgi:ribosomal protein L16/L10AE
LHLHALARSADCELRARQIDAARQAATAALDGIRRHSPFGLARTELLWIAYQALDAAGDDIAARAALQTGLDWIKEVAAEKLPEEFRASYCDRNPFVRAILTTASRRLR